MRFTILLLILISVVTVASAQVKVGATPTGKHASAIETAKQSKEEIKRRKEQAKKVGEYAKAKDKYKKKYEKLKGQKLKEWEKDSIQKPEIEKPTWSKQDSLAISKEILEKTNFPEEYKELILNPPALPGIDSVRIQSPDSALVNQVSSQAEQALESKAKEYLPDEMSQESDALNDLTTNPLEGGLSQPTSFKKPSRPNPNLVKPAAAKDLFSKIDPDQFRKVQTDITKLKKKYSSLPDTRKPEEGRKRNSLEDLPFKKRLYFGGNVNLSSTDPLIMDMNLQLGYWINKKWMAGAGFTLREQFNQRDSASLTSLTGDAYGYSLFVRYDILKEFYVWGEMQQQLNQGLINNESSGPSRWEEAYLLGVGRDFKIGPVRLTTLVMYDFNYQSNNLNNRPLVFRLGFQFTKRPE